MEIAFIHGFILAFGLILPLGVQNLFVFQQGLVQPKFCRAFPVIVTAAVCDTILISASVGGVSLLLFHFSALKTLITVAGAAFLLYMGLKTWRQPAAQGIEEAECLPLRRQVLFAVSVSFLNPYAILDVIGIIGTNSLEYDGTEKIVYAFACCLVSWVWFFALGAAGRMFGKMPDFKDKLRWLNRCSAVFIWCSAMALLTKTFLFA